MTPDNCRFHQMNLSKASFKDVALPESAFTDVNLSNSMFDDVNLRGARFTNIDFSDAEISCSRLVGMRIDGVLVTDLLAAYGAR